jgi:hypothetical protein
MIALGIGSLCHYKHLSWAEFNTESATLAAFFNDMDNAVRDSNTVFVKGLAPIFHDFSSNPE